MAKTLEQSNEKLVDTSVDAEPQTKEKKLRKKRERKDGNSNKEEVKPASTTGSFSLFGGKGDSQLNDIFSKGAAYVIAPSQPVASSSKPVTPVAAASLAEPASQSAVSAPRKRRRSSASSSTRNSAVKALAAKIEAGPSKNASAAVQADEAIGSDNEDDIEGDEDLVHESLKSGSSRQKRSRRAQKYIPEGESQEDRDRRTIFIGNLSLEVAKSKSGLNQLKAHIMTFVPGAKIESARLRSVPFATPTAGTGADDEAEGAKRAKREKERAKAWRNQQDVLKHGDKKEKEELDTSESFIDSKGKRKVAFIKKEFHTEADNCNAYVVFAHPPPDRPANLPPIMNPFEAAEKALAANGSVLLGHTIRVDVVRLASADGLAVATNNLKKRDAWTAGSDPKKSVFVGGLDYAAKDEDLRVFFEELIKKERGPKEGGQYVESVRVVRDKQTQMGKGFAYVHFTDSESVDEVLGVDDAKLKFAKKHLRIQRARTLPAFKPKEKTTVPTAATNKSGQKASTSTKSPSTKPTSFKQTPIGPIPKGNPLLGEKLRGLSKEERKTAKSEDSDRQARRMAKKKMRGKMGKEVEKGAVKLIPTKGEKANMKKKVVAKKGRVRSSNALAKMKGSRA